MFTFGSDPEFFVFKNENEVCSAIGIVPGTKNNRFNYHNNHYYYDNVLAECTIKPANTKSEAIQNINNALGGYSEIIGNYKIKPIPSHYMSDKELEHPHAMKIGCKREYCSYSMEEIEPDEEFLLNSNLRAAGGHIHLGAEFLRTGDFEDIKRNRIFLIRMLDLFVGIPATMIDQSVAAKDRKIIYGQAGRCRFPAYGVEYRTLSNFWFLRPSLTALIYDLCEFTINFVEKQKYLNFWTVNDYDDDQCNAYNCKEMCKILNENNYIGSTNILENFLCDLIPNKLYDRIWEEQSIPYVDMYAEWGIT